MKLSKTLLLLLVGSVLFMSGCANRDMQARDSGFLKSYEGIEEHDKLEGTRIHITPGTDFTKYENIYIADVEIISAISEKKWTPEQKILFEKMTEYLTAGYKTAVKEGTGYRLVENKKKPKTLIFEGAVSAVEVHFDDMEWYQFTPITLGLTGIARATYVDGAVRILGEGRFVDATTGKVLLRAMRLQKGEEVSTDADKLIFKDVKPALDAWLKGTNKNIEKLRNGVIKYQKKQD